MQIHAVIIMVGRIVQYRSSILVTVHNLSCTYIIISAYMCHIEFHINHFVIRKQSMCNKSLSEMHIVCAPVNSSIYSNNKHIHNASEVKYSFI